MTRKKAILTEVTAVRDEARVRMHLLSMEARERWYELEAQLDNIEHRLHASSDKVSDALLQSARDLTRSVLRLLEGQAQRAGLSASARTLMSGRFGSCSPEQSLEQAFEVLRASGSGSALVTDAEGKLLGMLGERDLCEAVCSRNKRPSEVTVASAMSTRVYTCSPQDTVARVLELMCEAQVHQLPVVDAEQHALGVVTLSAITHHVSASPPSAARSALLDALLDISAPAAPYVTAAE
jgi:CBS domain-containing protein